MKRLGLLLVGVLIALGLYAVVRYSPLSWQDKLNSAIDDNDPDAVEQVLNSNGRIRAEGATLKNDEGVPTLVSLIERYHGGRNDM